MTTLTTITDGLLSAALKLTREQDQRKRETGEDFNVFEIIKVGRFEVKTHSPMIGELLNPKGRHGCGAAFLRLFLERFPSPNFVAEGATVALESKYSAGPRTETTGGRIDIFLTDPKGRQIVIENKVYARDQEKQLKRYHETYENALLIYLTLDGSPPKDLKENEIPELKLASYRTDIVQWLKECEAICGLPIPVRENIAQYRRLIESLTHQTPSNSMNQPLIDKVVADEESLSAYFTLRDLEDAIHEELFKKLDKDLDRLQQEMGLDWYEKRQNMRKKHGGFSFTTPGLVAANLRIVFQFDAGEYRLFFFGFTLKDRDGSKPKKELLVEEFQKAFPGEADSDDHHWPAWAWDTEYQDWGAKQFEDLRSGAFATHLEKKLKKLIAVANTVCPNPKDHAN